MNLFIILILIIIIIFILLSIPYLKSIKLPPFTFYISSNPVEGFYDKGNIFTGFPFWNVQVGSKKICHTI